MQRRHEEQGYEFVDNLIKDKTRRFYLKIIPLDQVLNQNQNYRVFYAHPPPRHRRRPYPLGRHRHARHRAHHFRGSMNVPALVRVFADIRASQLAMRGVRLTIAMENAEAKYTLIDSGDAIADMYALAAQDILLLGESSWAVMVHLVALPGLTVVEFSGGNKYLNTTGFGRNVVMLGWRLAACPSAGAPRSRSCPSARCYCPRAARCASSSGSARGSHSLPCCTLAPSLGNVRARLLFRRVPVTHVAHRTANHAAPPACAALARHTRTYLHPLHPANRTRGETRVGTYAPAEHESEHNVEPAHAARESTDRRAMWKCQ
ncbi:hypothetical protein FB451DRAFT_1406323 [Mycena latifolia]|nr:hypothetical protein FB451DRAFT_1406323 [Mycena latifolia]